MAGCHADLLKYRTVVLKTRRAEGIHQTRVALRRLRAAFGLFRPAVDGPVVRSLAAEAKWLAGECGPARDLHVCLTETTTEAPPIVQRVARRLATTHLQRARSALASARFEGFQRQLLAFLDASPGAPSKRLDKFARSELEAHHKKVLRRGRKLESLDPERLHRLRVSIKKLHYAATSLGPAFASRDATPYIEATARLQGVLGDMNDRSVARHVLDDIATAARPTEAVAEPLALLARQVKSGDKRRRRKLVEAWKTFTKTEPFWRARTPQPEGKEP